MAESFVHKTYSIQGTEADVRVRLSDALMKSGFVAFGESGTIRYFKYPSLRFSSSKPLSCISGLSLDVIADANETAIDIGVTFTKIRYFTIIMMVVICIVLPVAAAFVRDGNPAVSLKSLAGIPAGFILHHFVRNRVFKALQQLVGNVGASVEMSQRL